MDITADVVIIGGGIIGASTLYHLVINGIHNVILIEKDLLGSGTTAYTAGWVRLQQSSILGCKMAQLSLKELSEISIEENIGLNIKGSISAYTFDLAEDENRLSNQLAQLGTYTELLNPNDIGNYAPFINTTGLALGRYCKDDGVVDANALLQFYIKRSKRSGVKILEGIKVKNILIERNTIVGIETTIGVINTNTIVNASGIYADLVGAWIGLKIPLIKKLGHNIFTEPIELIPNNMPLIEIIDKTPLYVGSSEKRADYTLGSFQIDSYEHKPQLNMVIEKFFDYLYFRAPALAEAGIVDCTAGIRANSPDDFPIIGPVDSLRGYINNCCFGSEGIIFAPIGGQIVADYILKGVSEKLPLEPFLLKRFETND